MRVLTTTPTRTLDRTGRDYSDLGDVFLDTLDQRAVTAGLVRRLERLGYQVQLQPKAA